MWKFYQKTTLSLLYELSNDFAQLRIVCRIFLIYTFLLSSFEKCAFLGIKLANIPPKNMSMLISDF